MAEPNSLATFDRPPVIERLNTVGKRKSTPPQKFMGVYFTHILTAFLYHCSFFFLCRVALHNYMQIFTIYYVFLGV